MARGPEGCVCVGPTCRNVLQRLGHGRPRPRAVSGKRGRCHAWGVSRSATCAQMRALPSRGAIRSSEKCLVCHTFLSLRTVGAKAQKFLLAVKGGNFVGAGRHCGWPASRKCRNLSAQ
eukprot:353972-Chlamydomonas_euryale.AAC.7